MLDDYLKDVTVLGAAGKMGSGISLLLLLEMAKLQARTTGKASGARLHLIDVSDQALDDLNGYLRAQLTRFAEKSINDLRAFYQDRADLIENREIINAFVDEALVNVRLDTDITKAKHSDMIFEAIIEDVAVKNQLLSKIKEVSTKKPYFFTNTSSIPITQLDDGAGLDGRIIGYHFYNPPAVQKLVELIVPKNTEKELVELSYELGKRLRKKLIPSNDVAGFIGNGHFMRDLLFGLELAGELGADVRDYEALYIVNRVTQDLMLRPMGIFQLIDYVGVDVCRLILKSMRDNLNDDTLHSDVLDRLMELGVKGGQRANGSQKDGIIKYVKNRPAGFYSLDKQDYVMTGDGDWVGKCDQKIGAFPDGHVPWKTLLGDPGRDSVLKVYFKNLFSSSTFGAALSRRYLENSRHIAHQLVSDGIANTVDDVNGVLLSGFYHIYGAENDFFEQVCGSCAQTGQLEKE